MRVHVHRRSQRLAKPPEEIFPFFADALNLERVTPPWLGFRVLTPGPIEMHAGARINYRLRLHGVALNWRTEIVAWLPPHRFIDVQRSGPYALWHHTHLFEPAGDGSIMHDVVRYGLPLGPLGSLADLVLVRRDLERIFEFRRDAVAELLDGSGRSSATR